MIDPLLRSPSFVKGHMGRSDRDLMLFLQFVHFGILILILKMLSQHGLLNLGQELEVRGVHSYLQGLLEELDFLKNNGPQSPIFGCWASLKNKLMELANIRKKNIFSQKRKRNIKQKLSPVPIHH